MAAFPEGYSLRGPSSKHPPKTWCLKMKDYKPSLAGALGGRAGRAWTCEGLGLLWWWR